MIGVRHLMIFTFQFLLLTLLTATAFWGKGQARPGGIVGRVNVFLGTSGDHGQLSPAASYPFSMLAIGPQTNPGIHTGYEHLAKEFTGFSINRFEGVGCRGSGGNLLVTPYLGKNGGMPLLKKTETGWPGYYQVGFTNGIKAKMTVTLNAGIEEFRFPGTEGGLRINLASSLANGFLAEDHEVEGNMVSGWVRSGTTCREGAYKLYYAIIADGADRWTQDGAQRLRCQLAPGSRSITLRVGISVIDQLHAENAVCVKSFHEVVSGTVQVWQKELGQVMISAGDREADQFYSYLYRTLQSPYLISEKDGIYRSTDGVSRTSKEPVYNGWAIWDNYRTQLPLLALAYPVHFQGIASSIAGLYRSGKKDWATMTEPSNTVRTEHAGIVLLDAWRKKYRVDFTQILDSMKMEADRLDFTHPDKALESSYDLWALSEIYQISGRDSLAANYRNKAKLYEQYWLKDFKDLSLPDVDRMGARGMYQGTVWQYRWLVPYDVKGLVRLCGGDTAYIAQLDRFFNGDYYNAGNETDIQVPFMYNASSHPWKSQLQVHRLAADTVVQMYSDYPLRGVDPMIGKVFNNSPQAMLRAMDDDAGAMSAWYILASMGLMPACVGHPVYYLSVPLVDRATLARWNFTIRVKNRAVDHPYIKAVWLNGTPLNRNWLTHQEITEGGELLIETSSLPNYTFGTHDQWSAEIK